MRRELLLARAFAGSRSGGAVGLPYVVSAGSVALGVTFVVFSVGVYDAYVGRLEALTLTLLPHVLLVDAATAGGRPADLDPGQCSAVCEGVELLRAGPPASLAVDRAELTSALAGAAPAAAVSEVVWSEADFTVAVGEVRHPTHLRVVGIDPGATLLVPRLDLLIPAADLRGLTDGHALISVELARRWSVGGKERIDVALAEGPSLPLSLDGSFSLAFRGVGGNLIVTTAATARALLGPRAGAYLGMSLPDPHAAPRVARVLGPVLRGRAHAVPWTMQAGQDFEALRLLRWIMVTILSVSLGIAALNIRNALTITALERRREIGILRSMGVRDRTLRATFLVLGLGVGSAGLVAGIPAGALLAAGFGRWIDARLGQAGLLPISVTSFRPSLEGIGEVAALVGLTCIVTALLAVRGALRLAPVECLQAE